MILREGAQASFIGEEDTLLAVGDRCLILASENTYSHVRWVSGSKVGTYDRVHNDDLVTDRSPARFDDEFTFETFSNRLVNVACREVLDRRGHHALLRAVEQEGHLAEIRATASALVAQLRLALSADESWAEVVEDLGQADAVQFQRFALRDMLEQALNEVVNDGSLQEA